MIFKTGFRPSETHVVASVVSIIHFTFPHDEKRWFCNEPPFLKITKYLSNMYSTYGRKNSPLLELSLEFLEIIGWRDQSRNHNAVSPLYPSIHFHVFLIFHLYQWYLLLRHSVMMTYAHSTMSVRRRFNKSFYSTPYDDLVMKIIPNWH